MNSVRYCAGPHLRLVDWAGLMRTAPAAPWPQLAGRRVVPTYRGRSAIHLAASLIGLRPGDEILVPAYNCGTEIDALCAAGMTVKAFRVDRSCNLDLDDAASRVTPRTRALYVIHYFGWEQRLPVVRTWCADRGLLLIEDCALALFSEGESGEVGRAGDAAIFSLPKTLGCRHGGILSLRSQHPARDLSPARGSRRFWAELRQSAQAAGMRALDAVGGYGPLQTLRSRRVMVAAPEQSLPDMPASYYFDPAVDQDAGMDERLWRLARTVLPQEVATRRRTNYQQLATAIRGAQQVRLLFPTLPPGVCPLAMPLVAPRRDETVAALQARGIAALPWWAGFHQGALPWAQFPDACWLKQSVLTVPVHHGLNRRQVAHIAAAVLELDRLSGEPGRN